jgi:hypothetical protein
MRTRRRATIEDLRLAVECLPRATRIAMVEGLRSNEIVVGAYSSDGGICPMLAAHRNGGRTNMISFAKAWDRFALGRGRATKPRRATVRELRVLTTHLDASLLDEELPRTELAAAIESHKRLLARREDERPRPGDPDRAEELRTRPGWAWTRLVRSYNEYERALEWIEREQQGLRQREHQKLEEHAHQALEQREYKPA